MCYIYTLFLNLFEFFFSVLSALKGGNENRSSTKRRSCLNSLLQDNLFFTPATNLIIQLFSFGRWILFCSL